MRRCISHLTLLGLLLVAFVPPAGAGEPAPVDPKAAKAATKQLAAMRRATLATLGEDLDGALAVFEPALKQFEETLPGGAADPEELLSLLQGLQGDVTSAMQVVIDEVVIETNLILDALDDVSPLMGRYPHGFYNGDGGILDSLDASMVKQVDKLYRKVRRRLSSTVSKAEKQGLLLTIVIERPLPPRVTGTANDDGGAYQHYLLSIDLAFAARVEGQETGFISTGGVGGFSGEALFAAISRSVGPFVEVATSFGRWSYTEEKEPGNYILYVREGTGGEQLSTVGLR